MKKIFILFIGVLLFTACENTDKQLSDKVIINGFFTKSQGEWIFLSELSAKSLSVIDSVKIGVDGNFHFEFTPTESPEFYVLQSRHFNQAITLLLEAGEVVSIEGDLPSLNDAYEVSNSVGSERVHELTQIINSRMGKVSIYYQAYRDNPDSMDLNTLRAKTDSLLRVNQIDVYNELQSFIKKEPASLSSLIALYSRFGRNTILDFKYDSSLFIMVSDSLIRKYPNSLHAIKLHQKILEFKNADKLKAEREEALSIGKVFPNLILNDIDNEPKELTGCKSKVCIVMIWESKNKESWDVNAKLRELYKKYQEKGLGIYEISFDTDKLAWTNYCHMEKLVWTNVIGMPRHKKMLNAEEKMPRLFLLDINKKILAVDPKIDDLDALIKPLL